MKRELKRLNRTRVVDDVRRKLEEAILSGKIKSGERLAETWLAEQFSVSRTSVREALLVLQGQGHVVSIPRRGTYVRRLSHEEALDICRLRALLEAYAIGVGYDHLGQETVSHLESLIEEILTCQVPDDLPRLIQIDLDFHRTLVQVAGSRRLSELYSNLDGQIGALYIRAVETRQVDIHFIAETHQNLLNAVRSGNAEIAQQAVVDHYITSADARNVASPLIMASLGALLPNLEFMERSTR